MIYSVRTLSAFLAPVLLVSYVSVSIAQEFPGVGKVRKLHGDFNFTEGPAFDGRKFLYFTDIPNDRILRTEMEGKVETFMEKAGHCNGLMVDGNGRLIACRMDGELISIDVDSRTVTTLAGTYKDVRFNACNDLVIDRLGGVYFTDPRFLAPQPWPQGKEAFYYRSKSGEVTRLGDDLQAPNGIILSPDEKKLYVIPSMQKQMFVYDVTDPGVISNKRVFCELKQPEGKESDGGDGLSIDVQGNLYITSALGVQVFSPDGKLLGVIPFPEQPANCSFAGRDRKTLVATCRTGVYVVDAPIAGHVFPGKVPAPGK